MSIRDRIVRYRKAWETPDGRRKSGNILRLISVAFLVLMLFLANSEHGLAILAAVMWVCGILASGLVLRSARKMEKEAEPPEADKNRC
ncbi:MAG: hypothetical protein NT130_05800 [Candidatus Micrarchaeota archaeon]|nr:hypothetical protein [Candidatus Micrarchaeota archaeon]